MSCAKLCLDIESPGFTQELFMAAVREGKLELLQWGQDSGYELNNILDNMLNEDAIADTAACGHLEIVKYLRNLGISWDEETCSNAALNGCLSWYFMG